MIHVKNFVCNAPVQNLWLSFIFSFPLNINILINPDNISIVPATIANIVYDFDISPGPQGNI